MRLQTFLKPLIAVAVVAGVGIAGYATRNRWVPFLQQPAPASTTEENTAAPAPAAKVIINEKAQENLGLKAKPLKTQIYWKSITVPGMVVDRPGLSDRGIIAPVTGVVTRIAHVPGDTVRPGEVLFTLRLLSETLHQTQTELFKATQDIALAEATRMRLVESKGAVPESRVIEVENQITRLRVAVKAYRQELQNRGFSPEQIEEVAKGTFVRDVPVVVPSPTLDSKPAGTQTSASSGDSPPTFEVQELKVDLGHQVLAGQTLCLLANHQKLAVAGRAFRDETPLLERSVRERWPVHVDFMEESGDWPPVEQAFYIQHLSNTIDPVNRTFEFRMPLENQSRVVKHEGETQTLWRFRPGQKVRLEVKVERLDNVFVLPSDAVARDGAEAYVFTQNVNTFTRNPVRVLLQDRTQVVIANDESLKPGTYVLQSAGAQLNRLVKAGGASGVPKGYHIHADGSLHKNEDEGK